MVPRGYLAVAALVGALTADVLTTWYGLSIGLVEANPAAVVALEAGGIAGFVAMSGAVLAITAVGAGAVHRLYGDEVPYAWRYPVWGVAGVNCLAALHNGLLILGV